MAKEDKECVRPEDVVENLLVDDISSDDSDSNVLAGGNYLFC